MADVDYVALYNEGVQKYQSGNKQEAIKIWEKAASMGSSDAKYQLGMQWISGETLNQDIARGIKIIEDGALNDSVLAMNTLIAIYEKGMLGIAPNHDKASFYCRKYVKSGQNDAMSFVREIAYRHIDDKKIYIKYLEVLSENKDYDAMVEAANIFISEFQDYSRAVKYYLEAYQAGSIKAAEKVAMIYKDGIYGVPKDYKKYFTIISNLAETHPEEERFVDELISLYEYGLYGVEKNLPKALDVIKNLSSTEINEEIYQFKLAEVIEVGRLGTKADPRRAIAKYTELLDKYPDNSTYLLKMAEIFEDGKFGVVRDTTKASQIYRSLINKNPNVPIYLFKLAKLYYKSTDAENQKQAYLNFSKAFELGNREAGYYVVFMNYDGGLKFPKDYGKAVAVADKITRLVIDSHELADEEQKLYQRMKTLEIMMYSVGGAKLPKNVRKAKEVMNDYNVVHKEKIKIKF